MASTSGLAMPASPAQPEISFVIPVYNKADILPRVVQALANQTLPAAAEYIFIDDASTDGSRTVLEQRGRALLPDLTLVANDRNAGPSIRLNQGAALARGRRLCLLDADELVIPDAVALMWQLMQQRGADMVHGKVHRFRGDALPEPLRQMPELDVSDTPLSSVIRGRGFVRMAWLVDTGLFHAAGGCDERLFIQDESLPLRLAAHARRFVDFRGTVSIAPPSGSHLSTDRRQQHHDRFFAYYYFLHETTGLSVADQRRIAQICVSMAWKAQQRSGLPLAMPTALMAYLRMKLGFGISPSYLDRAASAFRQLPDIRFPSP
jgi:glycosyltransferase involved in cell wall biosynthesis